MNEKIKEAMAGLFKQRLNES